VSTLSLAASRRIPVRKTLCCISSLTHDPFAVKQSLSDLLDGLPPAFDQSQQCIYEGVVAEKTLTRKLFLFPKVRQLFSLDADSSSLLILPS